mgnify:CR=1 FL=1
MRAPGFTLIELMVTLAIVAILLVLGAPVYTTWIQNMQIRTATESLVSAMKLARAEAIKRNVPVTFSLVTGPSAGNSTEWSITCNPAGPNCPEVGGVIQSDSLLRNAPHISVVPTAGDGAIVFSGLGQANPPALPVAALSTIDIDNPKLPPAESRELRVLVVASGELRACDPNVGAAADPRHC